MAEMHSWKTKTLVFGTVLGALAGLATAYLLTRRAEKEGKPLSLTSGQGIRLGVLLLGFIRQLLTLDEK
uniref:Uncharacterized protein n=1 Tax=uncultured Chloroflexota bacterium TaxID=166587 RepID=H5SFN8_9CHLR|nr:hypothetical protein HGMM_F22C05C20 [uncultured Chloroflexota bacterium]